MDRAPGPPPRRALRFRLLAALAAAPALLSGGCAAVPPSGGAAPVADIAALAGRFPASAAGFRRGLARPAVSGQGREVAYATDGGRLTAVATVELLAEDAAPAAALDAALADVLRAGPAREMREAGRFTATAAGAGGASPLVCARTAGRYGQERVAGLVCAGRAGGALLRIRVTMPAREPPPAEAIAAALSGSSAAAPAG